MNAKDANGYVENAIQELFRLFKDSPTIYLEEKHLHNEFDRILRRIIPEEEHTAFAISGRDDSSIVPFPVLMNEYATVNKYSRIEEFKEKLNFNRSTGSLDYVVLRPDWIKEVDYNTAVNKNEKNRKISRDNGDNGNRFLVTIEFKYSHYDKFRKSLDDKSIKINRAGSRYNKSIKALKKKIVQGMKSDINKLINENADFAHVLYFNSDLDLNSAIDDNGERIDKIKEITEGNTVDMIKGIKSYIDEKKESNGNKKTIFKVWYAQGGVNWRFGEDSHLAYMLYPEFKQILNSA